MFNYQKFSRNKVFQVLEECGVPKTLHNEAWQSISEGFKMARGSRPMWHNLTAPIVTPFVLAFTPWEAEKLPTLFRGYDNDTNLNGDRGPFPVSYNPTNEEAIANCFYNPGHHPREFMSRYKWIGLRNRGKWSYMKEMGYVRPSDKAKPERYWGVPGLTRGDANIEPVTGWAVTEWAGYWQIIGTHPMTGFMEGRFHEPRWGWKTGLSKHLDNGHAMSVAVGPKMRKRKGD